MWCCSESSLNATAAMASCSPLSIHLAADCVDDASVRRWRERRANGPPDSPFRLKNEMHGEDQDDFPVPWPYRGQSKLREAMASRASNSLLSGVEVLE